MCRRRFDGSFHPLATADVHAEPLSVALTPLFAQARSRIKSADHRVDYAHVAAPTEEIEYTTFQRAA